MYSIINLLNAVAFRYRVAAVYDVLLVAPEPITKQEIHDDFLKAWVGLGGTRCAGQAAWRRLAVLDNPAAAELALYARMLGVNTTWLLTGDLRFINRDLFTNTCLCYIHSSRALKHGPDCPLHAPLVTPSPLAHQGTVVLAQPRTKIQSWSAIAGATFPHDPEMDTMTVNQPEVYTLTAPSLPEETDPIIAQAMIASIVGGSHVPGTYKSDGLLTTMMKERLSQKEVTVIDAKDGIVFLDELSFHQKEPLVDSAFLTAVVRKATLPSVSNPSDRK